MKPVIVDIAAGDAAKLLLLFKVYQAFIAMSLLMIIPVSSLIRKLRDLTHIFQFAISAASAMATWVCQCKEMICDDDGLTREETVQGCKSFIDIIITLGSKFRHFDHDAYSKALLSPIRT